MESIFWCFTGQTPSYKLIKENEIARVENRIIVYAFSKSTQDTLENPNWNSSTFTQSIVERLNGKADLNQDNKITSNELDSYLSNRAKELTNGNTTKLKNVPQFTHRH